MAAPTTKRKKAPQGMLIFVLGLLVGVFFSHTILCSGNVHYSEGEALRLQAVAKLMKDKKLIDTVHRALFFDESIRGQVKRELALDTKLRDSTKLELMGNMEFSAEVGVSLFFDPQFRDNVRQLLIDDVEFMEDLRETMLRNESYKAELTQSLLSERKFKEEIKSDLTNDAEFREGMLEEILDCAMLKEEYFLKEWREVLMNDERFRNSVMKELLYSDTCREAVKPLLDTFAGNCYEPDTVLTTEDFQKWKRDMYSSAAFTSAETRNLYPSVTQDKTLREAKLKYHRNETTVDTRFLVGEHRWFSGGAWTRGAEAHYFLLSKGLKPQHKLLDLGCGSLRLGVHSIRYLTPGNYYGIDSDELSQLEGGVEFEVPMADLMPKEPHLLLSKSLSVERFQTQFDFVMAFESIKKSMGVKGRKEILKKVVNVLRPGGRLLLISSDSSLFHQILVDNGLQLEDTGSMDTLFMERPFTAGFYHEYSKKGLVGSR